VRCASAGAEGPPRRRALRGPCLCSNPPGKKKKKKGELDFGSLIGFGQRLVSGSRMRLAPCSPELSHASCSSRCHMRLMG
jgi:hypothetical protein